jgi:hypothetical protein
MISRKPGIKEARKNRHLRPDVNNIEGRMKQPGGGK